MDRREPARITDAEVDPTGPSAPGRLAIGDSTGHSGRDRPAGIRRWLKLGVATTLAILAAILIVWSSRSAVEFLRSSPARTCRFREIELEPGLPPWIGVPRQEFLERFRGDSGLADAVHVLRPSEVESIRLAFETRLAWARKVRGIRAAYPNRLIVSLEYREPVAYVPMSGSPSIILDGDAVVLPSADLAPKSRAVGRLIELKFPEDHLLASATPGVALTTRARLDGEPGTDLAVEFATLASALSRLGPADDAPRFRLIQKEKDVFWALLDDGTDGVRAFLRWGQAPGSERPGEPSVSEKWTRLRAWLASHRLSEGARPAFLRFTAAGVEVQRPPG